MHAAMIYDTLFSWDADMVPRPQMVESWTKSDDRLLYTFTLRPGLKFHDGSPVTTRDVIATLRRHAPARLAEPDSRQPGRRRWTAWTTAPSRCG